MFGPPEEQVIAKDQGHGLECDMWSVGVMTYLLLCGKLPYNTKEAAALGHQIRFMPHAYNGEVSDVVNSIWCKNNGVVERRGWCRFEAIAGATIHEGVRWH